MLSPSRFRSLWLPLLALGAAVVTASCKDNSHALGSTCTMTSDCDRGLVCDIWGDKTCHHLGDTKPEPEVDAAPLPPPVDAMISPADRKPPNRGGGEAGSAVDSGSSDDGANSDAEKGDGKKEAGSSADATSPTGDASAATNDASVATNDASVATNDASAAD